MKQSGMGQSHSEYHNPIKLNVTLSCSVLFSYNILTMHIMFLMPFSLQYMTWHWSDAKHTWISLVKKKKKNKHRNKVIPEQIQLVWRLSKHMRSSVYLIKATKASWSKPSLQTGYSDHSRIQSPCYQNTSESATIGFILGPRGCQRGISIKGGAERGEESPQEGWKHPPCSQEQFFM